MSPRTTDVDPPRAAPRQTPLSLDSRALWVRVLPAALAALLIRVTVAAVDRIPTADATAFLTSGESLLSGDGYARYGVAETGVPPLVPAMLAGLARLFDDATVGFSAHHVLWGTVLVFPVAAVGLAVAGPRAGLRAAWAAALSPGLAVALGISGGGSELPALVALFTALALVVDRAAAPVGWRAAAIGASCGLAYLFRADTLLACLLVLAALWLRLHRRRSGGTGQTWRATVTASAVALVVALPWPVWVYEQTGRVQLSGKASESTIEGWEALARHDRVARDALIYRLDDSGEIVGRQQVSLVALATADPRSFLSVQRENLATLAEEVLVPQARWPASSWTLPPSWELVPLPGLLLAAWAAWRRRRQPRVQLLLGVAAANVVVIMAFFVQDRYLATSVAVACVLIGAGLADLPSSSARRATQSLLVVLAALAIGADVTSRLAGPPSSEPTDHRAVGEMLATSTSADESVMTRSMTVRYYLGRRTVPFPYGEPDEVMDYACRKGVDLIVVDERQVAQMRPQLQPWLGSGPWPGLRLDMELVVDGRLVRVLETTDC